MSIAATDIRWASGGEAIVQGVTLEVREGETFGLLGPNGSGKSSLLRVLAGLRVPQSGQVALDGADLRAMAPRRIARRIAVVEQHAATDIAISVIEVVRLGRTPHHGILSGWTAEDDRIVEKALARVDLGHRRNQPFHTLSGGERQRVQLARALAQNPTHLILDEPTNHLDIQHQLEILALVQALPITSIVALHDLNLAAMFCDRLGVMKAGRLIACGAPEDVLSAAMIADVFGVRAHVAPSAHHGRVHVQFLR